MSVDFFLCLSTILLFLPLCFIVWSLWIFYRSVHCCLTYVAKSSCTVLSCPLTSSSCLYIFPTTAPTFEISSKPSIYPFTNMYINMYIYPSFQSRVTFRADLFTLLLYISWMFALIHRVLNETLLFFYTSYCRFLDMIYQTRCISKATFHLDRLPIVSFKYCLEFLTFKDRSHLSKSYLLQFSCFYD